jgi:hypothetical protein
MGTESSSSSRDNCFKTKVIAQNLLEDELKIQSNIVDYMLGCEVLILSESDSERHQ